MKERSVIRELRRSRATRCVFEASSILVPSIQIADGETAEHNRPRLFIIVGKRTMSLP